MQPVASDLGLEVVLHPELVDQAELLFEPIGAVLFRICQQLFQNAPRLEDSRRFADVNGRCLAVV